MKRFWDLLAGRGMPVAMASGSSTKAITAAGAGSGQVQVVVSADAGGPRQAGARRLPGGGAPAGQPRRNCECAVVEDSKPWAGGAARLHALHRRALLHNRLDDGFLMADLLEDGMEAFDPLRALEWLDAQSAPRG